jgi:hypothetical protein
MKSKRNWPKRPNPVTVRGGGKPDPKINIPRKLVGMFRSFKVRNNDKAFGNCCNTPEKKAKQQAQKLQRELEKALIPV